MPDAIAFASVFIGATTFTGLNERQLEAIARLCIQTVVKKGERLIEQDIPVQTLNVIVSGRLVADTGQPVGDRLEAGRSDAIEEPAFFKRAGALHTWTAMRETVALALPYGEMLAACLRDGDLLAGLLASHFVQRPSAMHRPPSRILLAPAGSELKNWATLQDAVLVGFEACADVRVLTSQSFGGVHPGALTVDLPETSHLLHEQELAFPLTIVVADPDNVTFTNDAIEEVDEIVFVANAGRADLNRFEMHAIAARGPRKCRLLFGAAGGRTWKEAAWREGRRYASVYQFEALDAHSLKQACFTILNGTKGQV